MSEESSIEQVDALIQRGDFREANNMASQIGTSDLSGEEQEKFRTLTQALRMDRVTIGCIIGLSSLWIYLALSAI